MKITSDKLVLLKVQPAIAAKFEKPLQDTLERYKINTRLRVCHFLSQILHESWRLTRVEENLNYTPDAILATFNNPKKKRFTLKQAGDYGRTATHPANREMIANIAYANRMGNGLVESGDGFKFRGRGPGQITGQVNYKETEKALNIPCVENPDLLFEPEHGCMAFGHYWNVRNLNALADKDDTEGITKSINGGLNGYNERLELLQLCKKVFKEESKEA